MPWHCAPSLDLSHLAPALAQIEPILCIPFDAFEKLCVVDAAEDNELTLRVRHLGGAKMQATMAAIVQRQLDLTFPGRYQATLRDAGQLTAALTVRACAPAHTEGG